MSTADDSVGTGSERILVNTVWRAAADIGSKIISVAFFVLLARRLGEEGFGVFVLGFTLAAILTVPAGFGQDPVLTREVARDRTRLEAYFWNTIGLKLALALPILLVAAVVSAAAGISSETRSVVLLLGLALLVEQLTNTCFAVYQAFEQLVYVPVVILTQRALTAAVGTVALLEGAGVVAVSAIYLAGSLVALLLGLALLRARVARPRLTLTPRAWPALFAGAAAVGVATVLSLLLFRADTAILALFEPKKVVGNYGAAFRLFEATLFVSWAVTTAAFPVLARVTRTSRPSVNDVFDGSLKLLVALTLPISVATAILAEPIIDLIFGPEFEDAALPLALLAPAIVFYSIAYLSGGLLVAQNRQRAAAIAYGGLAVVNIAASFLLIPVFSLNGAAIAALGTQVGLCAALLAVAYRVTGSIDWRRILAGPVTASVLLGLTALALRDSLWPALAAGAAVYLVALTTVENLAYPQDAQRVWSFLRQSRAAAAASR